MLKHRLKFSWLLAGAGSIFPVITLANPAPPDIAPDVGWTTIATSTPAGASSYYVSFSIPAGGITRYTLNGQEPIVYDQPAPAYIIVTGDVTVKAKSWAGGLASTTTTKQCRVTGDISAGSQHVLALKANGDVYGWGNRANGRLANGVTTSGTVTSPTQFLAQGIPSTPLKARLIAAGDGHSLAEGQFTWAVYGSGLNSNGQVGDATTTTRGAAVLAQQSGGAPYLSSLFDMSAGSNFSVGIQGTNVYAWGYAGSGSIGDGSTFFGNQTYAYLPVRNNITGTPVLNNVFAVRAGKGHALACVQDSDINGIPVGTVYSWGLNANGQLGNGNTFNAWIASSTGLTDVTDMAAGDLHSAAVRWKTGDSNLQGSVWSFGYRQKGRLGDNGATTGNATSAVQVQVSGGGTLQGVIQVSAGNNHTLALDQNGNVWAWGGNDYGQLGDNTTTDRKYAAKVKNPAGSGDLSNIIKVSAGGSGGSANASFSSALAADGTVYTWGYNQYGQLGNGSTGTSAVSLPAAVPGFNVLPGYPSATLSASVSGSDLTLTASPSDPDGAGDIASVEVYVHSMPTVNPGDGLVATLTSAPWTHTLNGLTPGPYYCYVIVRDAEGNVVQSDMITANIP